MAYAFSNLQDILDQNNPDKQNIFNNGGTQPGATGGPPAPQSQASQAPTTTDTSGDLGKTATSSTTSPSGQSNQAAQDTNNSDSSRAAYTANVGKADTPYAVDYANQQLSGKESGLQSQADQYYQNSLAAQNYSIGNDSLNQAVQQGNSGTDADNFAKITSTLNQTNPTASPTFTPIDTNVNEVNLLSTPAGQSQLVKEGQAPSYTQGMADFDVAALQGNPNFTSLRDQLLQRQSDLNQKATDLTTNLPQQEQTLGATNLAQSQQAIKDYLNNNQSQILTSEQQAAQAKQAQDQQAFQAAQQAALPAALASAKTNLSSLDPQAVAYLNSNGIDLNKYGSVHGAYQTNEAATPDQISQFNNISALLGLQNAQTAGAQVPGYTLNTNALTNDIQNNAEAAWAPVKAGYQNQIAQIQANEAAQANAENAARAKLNPTTISNQEFQNLVAQLGQSPGTTASSLPQGNAYAPGSAAIPSTTPGSLQVTTPDSLSNVQAPVKGNQQLAALNAMQNSIGGLQSFGYDPTKYLQINPSQFTGGNFVSASDAAQLNALATKLGQPANYQASAPIVSPYTYNSQQAFQNLQDLLNNYNANKPHMTVAPTPMGAATRVVNPGQAIIG